jgi:hypothetical protein
MVGDTWTDEQRAHLAVFFAAEQSVRRYGISVKPSHTGDGVFAGKDIPQYARVGYYTGVVENARDGYSIGLPPITFPDRAVVPAVLSGYAQRQSEGSASMFNHSCCKYNAEFLLEASIVLFSYCVVTVMTNLDGGVEADEEIRDTPLSRPKNAPDCNFATNTVHSGDESALDCC